MLEKLFKLSEHNTNIKTEVIAGITTFLTMAYIIFVNPDVLSAAGMDTGAVFVATCVAAAIGCFIMGIWANYPVAMAPGMGLNAFFSYTVVGQMGYSWQVAMGAVFISGVCFLLLSAFSFREWVINNIPLSLRSGIGAGIGLFLALIALKNAGIVVDNANTLVTMGDLTQLSPILACLGFIIIAALYARNITGSVMIGIITVTLISLMLGLIEFKGIVSMPPPVTPTLMQLDIAGALNIGMAVVIFSFLFVDLFDTSGTLIAVAKEGDLLDKNHNLPRLGRALMADSGATVVGSLLGTSTVTSYIESGSGISAGGRTGLTAVITGILFLVALFFSPLAALIPSYATAPALFFVAVLMASNLSNVKWSDITEAAPVVIAAVAMPLTFSISSGIMLGFISYTAIKILTGKFKDLNSAMLLLPIMFIIKIIFAS